MKKIAGILMTYACLAKVSAKMGQLKSQTARSSRGIFVVVQFYILERIKVQMTTFHGHPIKDRWDKNTSSYPFMTSFSDVHGNEFVYIYVDSSITDLTRKTHVRNDVKASTPQHIITLNQSESFEEF